eukprot:5580907-Karenia_brevis.AAC.1
MISGSGRNAWMMIRDVPKKLVLLAKPIDAAFKFQGGTLVVKKPNMNLGAEHIGMKRNLYDLSSVLPETWMTEEQWTEFL